MNIEDIVIKILIVLVTPAFLLLLVFIIVLPFVVITEVISPSPTISLVKSEWECVSYSTHYLGKTVTTRCDFYKRKSVNE